MKYHHCAVNLATRYAILAARSPGTPLANNSSFSVAAGFQAGADYGGYRSIQVHGDSCGEREAGTARRKCL
ncbi:MAG TPA: hypothetical protein VMW83_03000 [Spirochaetia bacterium]|nr:hypothetical protein [Spirochaetia bacterium]